MRRQKELSFWRWMEEIGIKKSTGYYHMRKLLQEMQERGLVKVEQSLKFKHVIVLDEEKLLEFMREKGLCVPVKAKA